MDPTNNLVPGDAAAPAEPIPAAPAPESPAEPVIDTAALESAMAGINPAASVADAAMNGATPVVTTTDETAADVAPEPTLQMPEPATEPLAPAPEAPASEGPVTIAPSADFQMSETSTVSAVQNGADGNLAAAQDEIMIGQPLEAPATEVGAPATEVGTPAPEIDTQETEEQNTGGNVADFNDPEAAEQAEAKAAEAANKGDDEEEEPLVAAAPVPGSIGSAKSYADIQRAEAEKAAKMAAKNELKNKMDKKTISIIAIIGVVVVAIIVAVVILMSSSSTPNPQPNVNPTPIEEEHDYSTLSCKRNLAPEEYASYGAVSGTQENVFYFKDDELDGLVTNFAYTYANQALAEIARDTFKRDYGVADEPEDEETEEEEEEAEETEKKTTAEMLHHYVSMKDYTVTHGMEIKSEDIKDWLESDAYSDVTYGATENGAAAPTEEGEEEEEEVTKNLKYYNRLQNSIDYTCSISKGY
jgi:uncharacterized protein YpmB